MSKTILITGATDGIGRETARLLVGEGHRVLLHGRNPDKLARLQAELGTAPGFVADFSDLAAVARMARSVTAAHPRLDALINNAGVLEVQPARTAAGLDLRFVVNTLAPVVLTRGLLPVLGTDARVVNLSSAAQSPVDPDALAGRRALSSFEAYAQSKLALTVWSAALADRLGLDGPAIIAVNPGSLLDTRMVREGFGRSRAGPEVGAAILAKAALSPDFADASGRYFDNDSGRFAPPHAAARDPRHVAAVLAGIDALVGGVA